MSVNETNVDALLADLKSGVIFTKRSAARKLGTLETSSQRVVEALIEARDTDWDNETRLIASESLAAPAHQAFIQSNPALLAAFTKNQREVQQRLAQVALAPGVSYSWRQTWQMALTKPTVETFESISQDSAASARRAFAWLVITAVLSRILLFILQLLFGGLGTDPQYGTLFLGAIGNGFVSAAAISIEVGMIYLAAWMFGGRASYSTLIYTFASFAAPLMFINVLGAIIPVDFTSLFLLIVGGYELVLNLNAVKAVYHLRTFVTCLVTIILPAVMIIVVVFLLASTGLIQLPVVPTTP